MKARDLMLLAVLAITLPGPCMAAAGDIDHLIEQVRQEASQELRYGKEREQRFLEEQQKQQALLQQARKERDALNREADRLRARYESNEREITARRDALAEASAELGDLFAIVRQAALAADNVVESSMVSVQYPDRAALLNRLGKSERTPSLDDIRSIWLAALTEISEAGKVVKLEAPVITGEGDERALPVVRVGVHTATSEGRFLRYLPDARKFVELRRQPPARFRSMAAELQEAADGIRAVPLDPSKGAILALLVQTPDLQEQIAQGGVIGYIILVLGLVGLVIVIERFVGLWVAGRRIDRAAKAGDEEVAEDNALGRLRKVVAGPGKQGADALGVQLDEQMALESARLQRGLATVAVLAAVSPLLGLLGTVTGMIQTFQSITLFGTGDPKLMSGGISEALITTQLGLSVAIPLVLLHSLLTGRANAVIDTLGKHASELYARHVAG
jgi:biopolymer transport protein ExbB